MDLTIVEREAFYSADSFDDARDNSGAHPSVLLMEG